MKNDRKGKGNPMYGKKPWNFQKTKEDNESVKQISCKMKNRKLS